MKVVGTPEEIEAANSDDPAVSRKALETLLEKNPDNAMLLARLGAALSHRRDPNRSLDYHKRAAAIEPSNVDYATGYSAALVQAKRGAEAATILSSRGGCGSEQLRRSCEPGNRTIRTEAVCRGAGRICLAAKEQTGSFGGTLFHCHGA